MNKKIIVKQRDIKDCGICCLESIIKYYNGYIPLEKLRLDTKTGKNGTTALNLIKTAKKYGLNAIGYKNINIKDDNIILPAIAHTITEKGINHFVVIYKIKANHFFIMDPAKGYIKVKEEEFLKKWTNVILIFKPYKKIPLYKVKNKILDTFFEIILQEKSLIYQIIISSIILTFLSIVLSYYFKTIINSIETNYITTTYIIILVFLILNMIKIYLEHIRNNLIIYLNKNIDLSIIPNFISHIFNLPLDIINSHTSGEVITRINEMYNIKSLFSEIFVTVLLDLFLCIASAYFLYSISNKLFLILCIISVTYIIIGFILNPIIIKGINDNIDLETDFNSRLSEEISTLETNKNLNLASKKINILTALFSKYQKSVFDNLKKINVIRTIKNIIKDLGAFSITSYGIILITNQELNLLSLITFNTLLMYFLEPIENSINLLPQFNLIHLSFKKISEFMELNPEKIGKQEKFINGDIQFQNISYSYNNFNKVLSNVSLNIKENSHNMIVGSTGCGKTTLVKMLNLNIKDYTGTIKINNINIKDYSLITLRKNILYVSQKEKLFTDTILNNISLFKKIDKKELERVLKITKVDEIIDKKELRLESIIYNEGYNLSGGERQRIILARSLLQKPKILIMDESLSEVDKKTENEILASIDKYLKTTTIIYISHTESNYFKNRLTIKEQYD